MASVSDESAEPHLKDLLPGHRAACGVISMGVLVSLLILLMPFGLAPIPEIVLEVPQKGYRALWWFSDKEDEENGIEEKETLEETSEKKFELRMCAVKVIDNGDKTSEIFKFNCRSVTGTPHNASTTYFSDTYHSWTPESFSLNWASTYICFFEVLPVHVLTYSLDEIRIEKHIKKPHVEHFKISGSDLHEAAGRETGVVQRFGYDKNDDWRPLSASSPNQWGEAMSYMYDSSRPEFDKQRECLEECS